MADEDFYTLHSCQKCDGDSAILQKQHHKYSVFQLYISAHCNLTTTTHAYAIKKLFTSHSLSDTQTNKALHVCNQSNQVCE